MASRLLLDPQATSLSTPPSSVWTEIERELAAPPTASVWDEIDRELAAPAVTTPVLDPIRPEPAHRQPRASLAPMAPMPAHRQSTPLRPGSTGPSLEEVVAAKPNQRPRQAGGVTNPASVQEPNPALRGLTSDLPQLPEAMGREAGGALARLIADAKARWATQPDKLRAVLARLVPPAEAGADDPDAAPPSTGSGLAGLLHATRRVGQPPIAPVSPTPPETGSSLAGLLHASRSLGQPSVAPARQPSAATDRLPMTGATLAGLQSGDVLRRLAGRASQPVTLGNPVESMGRDVGAAVGETAESFATQPGRLRDLGISAVTGATDVVAGAIGLGSIGSGGEFGKLAQALGLEPDQAATILRRGYSPQQLEAFKHVEDAKGFAATALALAQNPSVTLQQVVRSAPSMLLGAAIGQRLAVGAVLGAAIGEGATHAGQAAEQSRQASATGLLTPQQVQYAVTAGILDAAIASASGTVAQRLGFVDIDTMLVAGRSNPVLQGSIAKGIAQAVAQEGLFEEFTQSTQEAIFQNLADGQTWDKDIGKAAAEGLFAGSAMGVSANLMSARGPRTSAAPPVTPRQFARAVESPAPATTETPNSQLPTPNSQPSTSGMAPLTTPNPPGSRYAAIPVPRGPDGRMVSEPAPVRTSTPPAPLTPDRIDALLAKGYSQAQIDHLSTQQAEEILGPVPVAETTPPVAQPFSDPDTLIAAVDQALGETIEPIPDTVPPVSETTAPVLDTIPAVTETTPPSADTRALEDLSDDEFTALIQAELDKETARPTVPAADERVPLGTAVAPTAEARGSTQPADAAPTLPLVGTDTQQTVAPLGAEVTRGGWKRGPGSYVYQVVTRQNGTVLYSKRREGGEQSGFYVTKTGAFKDSDQVVFNDVHHMDDLWTAPDNATRDAVLAVVDQIAQLDVSDPKRGPLKAQLVAIVTGKPEVSGKLSQPADAAPTPRKFSSTQVEGLGERAAAIREAPVSGAKDSRNTGNDVTLRMGARRFNDEVVLRIVRTIPVAVVDELGGEQRATETLLHDYAMLADSLPVDLSADVLRRIAAAREVVAGEGAELHGISYAFRHPEYLQAFEALHRNLRKGADAVLAPEPLPAALAGESLPVATSRAESTSVRPDKLAGVNEEVRPAELTGARDLHGGMVSPSHTADATVTFSGKNGDVVTIPLSGQARATPRVSATQPVTVTKGDTARAGEFYTMAPQDIQVDAQRFQFKQGGNAQGVTSQAKIEGPWNEARSGVLMVWKDPANGQTYVVNGHHRLAAAQQRGVERVAVRYIEARDAKEARIEGALTNIAEDKGTPIDVAKLIRDAAFTPKQLADAGLSQRSILLRDGMGLAQLSDPLFARVVSGEISEPIGGAIGSAGLSQEGQAAVAKLVDRQQAKGRTLTPGQVRALAEDVASTPEVASGGGTQTDIFGALGEERTQNVAVEKAVLADWVRSELTKDKRILGYVAKAGRADTLAKGGNVINVAASQAIASEAAAVGEVFDRLWRATGPVSAALNRAATRVATGDPIHDVRSTLLAAIRDAVAAELGPRAHAGTTGPGARISETPHRERRPADSRASQDPVVPASEADDFARDLAALRGDAPLFTRRASSLPVTPRETQPSLPGTETVRDTEIATPAFDVPFALTPETPTASKPRTPQATFFDEPLFSDDTFDEPTREVYLRTYAEMGTTLLTSIRGRATPITVLDAGSRLTPDERAALLANPAVQRVAAVLLRVLDDIVTARYGDAHGIERTGLVLDAQTLGVFIPKPSLYEQLATILINPFGVMRGTPTQSADEAYRTLVHEAVHWEVREDSPRFEHALARQLDALGDSFRRTATARIVRAYANPARPGQYDPALREALSIYSASRRRPATAVDAISRTRRNPTRPSTQSSAKGQPARPLRSGRERTVTREELAALAKKHGTSLAVQRARARRAGYTVTDEVTPGQLLTPSGTASTGTFADGSPVRPGRVPDARAPLQQQRPIPFGGDKGTRTVQSSVDAIRPVEVPELVELATRLQATPAVVKQFRGNPKHGLFTAGGIRLHADLFKRGQERQLASTLAHEIGHLIDWLPNQTLKRGNLLGRLLSLRSFLKHTFTADDGTTIKNTTIRAELIALSDQWRPWDPEKASKSFRAYRRSGTELYADALSVLLNNPGLLETEAPIFYRQFFEALDAKPEVEQAYFELQGLLTGTPEDLIARRHRHVMDMFVRGDEAAMGAERRRKDKAEARKAYWLRLRTEMVDKHTPFILKEKALRQRGIALPPGEDARYLLSERNYLGGKVKAFIERHIEPIVAALEAETIPWHTFGAVLMYERIMAGDRAELANPLGLAPKQAAEQHTAVFRALSPAQRTTLNTQIDRFRTAMQTVTAKAYRAELYTAEMYDQMMANPAYATYRVLDFIDDGVSSRVFRQVGTLKDVQNVADATILKAIVTIQATEHNAVKLAAFAELDQYFPEDAERAKEVYTGKGHVPVEPKKGDGRELVRYFEHGRLRGRYVNTFIADSLNNKTVEAGAVVHALGWLNSHWFRPVFTTFNTGFQLFNVKRDFSRTWKATPGMSLRTLLKRYRQAHPMARVRAFGLSDQPTAKARAGHEDLLQAEEAGILSVTFNDIMQGRELEDTQIEETLAKHQIGGYGTPAPRHVLLQPLVSTLHWIKQVGDYIETLPKGALIHEFKGAGQVRDIPADQRAFIRERVGTPDVLAGGTWKPTSNNLMLFSNVIVQGMRADLKTAATDPKTRAGFWWKTLAEVIVPKLAMFALATAAGLAGDDEEEQDGWLQAAARAFRGVSEYDKTNYTPIPIGVTALGETVYLRIPSDDTGRLLGGLTWKALQLARGDRPTLETAAHVLSYMAGQAPTLTPTVGAIRDTVTFLSGQNVYDDFRSRFLFSDDELKAGGWQKTKKFLGYEFQELGGGAFWKFYAGEARPRARSVGQRILEAPIVSNIVGRFLKVSNFGETEELREVQRREQKAEATTRLAERDAVHDAITTFRGRPAAEQTPAARATLKVGIVDQIYPDRPRAERDRRDREIGQKIALGVLRAEGDPLTNAVLSATSNAQKTAMMIAAKRKMSDKEWGAWWTSAVDAGMISDPLYELFSERVRQQ